jgi:hypothetical protein
MRNPDLRLRELASSRDLAAFIDQNQGKVPRAVAGMRRA